MAAEDSRTAERLPVAMRIKLKYADVDTFIQRYAVNISRGGVFIATRSPKPVGTLLRFEFQLASSLPVLRGEGQVIWVRPFDPEQPRRVHGMGVRFTRLDAESRQIVERALEWRREHQEATEAPREEAGPEEPLEPSEALAPPEERVEQTSQPPLVSETPADREANPPSPMELMPERAPAEPAPAPPAEGTQHEIVAELQQSSQSQVVRAAHHIAQLTAGQSYFPEDAELTELLKPVRIEMPDSGREAARRLRAMLG
ncbi:MAG: TIGR02266 family protein [Myxococcales bacterium]|nr:TIGR02266 family protein [Myxococcota bacterium]MDW8283825.1 TIGR02266 family protein [Myxococcales bacterium]